MTVQTEGMNEDALVAQLVDALERAHDAIGDLVPSGVPWDWWLVGETGNAAHLGLHDVIEQALAAAVGKRR